MILLRATPELKYTFERLIDAMKAPVQWNGIFLVIDNYLILQGEVRSLFFHFDDRKVGTNIFDIELKEDEIRDITGNTHVLNVINMILYAFGKWGTLRGIRVEKNYEQLNALFSGVMQEIAVEPEYNYQYFRFYKEGIRVTYEDVVSYALEWQEKPGETAEQPEEEGGLWHKLLWKKRTCSFPESEIAPEDRKKHRLGNNFYMVGYGCPDCGEGLHMVVYPVGKEFRIETEEGAVLLARAFACDKCKKFYTPRPEHLLADGDIYCMDFEGDGKAYLDYLELLGKNGERISNPNYNRFVTPKPKEGVEDAKNPENAGNPEEIQNAPETLAEALLKTDWENPAEVAELSEKLEAGFFPEGEETEKARERVLKRQKELRQNPMRTEREKSQSKESAAGRQMGGASGGQREETVHRQNEQTSGESGQRNDSGYASDKAEIQTQGGAASQAPEGSARQTPGEESLQTPGDAVRQETERRYEARFQMLDRLSPRQLGELKRQLEQEKNLMPERRQAYLKQVEEAVIKEKAGQLSKRVDSCQGKPYTVLKRVYEEVAGADLPQEITEPLRKRLEEEMKAQGTVEVKKLMEKMPPRMDRARYKVFADKIHSYEGVDLTPYEARLNESRREAEKQEIANVVSRARKTERGDYVELAKKLRDGDFLPELVMPYLDKLDEKIKKLDEEAIDEITGDVMHKDFNEAAEAFEKIRDGDFLPELKTNAMEMLEKRLSKIKADECELLVKKLQEDFTEAGIGENERHHFYPARKVVLKQAEPEETEVIDYALASYAAGRGLFEYPILVADTSKNRSGGEGFILTPEHFYYSTLLTSYGFPVSSIREITASTGLLNRGLYVHRKNGDKLKVPYAVESKKLPALAETLNEFVHYLQEKPPSRQVTYLAKEKHDKICCFRCGYLYQGGDICPKCGFKNNE